MDVDEKHAQPEHIEDDRSITKGGLDNSSAVICTEDDNKRILKRTDIRILTVLMGLYFLQIADKTIIGLTAVYGLRRDAKLVGDQYSWIGAIGYYGQLIAQPLAAYALVKFRYTVTMTTIVCAWSVSLLGMCASENFKSLMATRFLLGFFEAAAIPLFSVITISFYRRTEQPLRVAAWYSTNGLANLICSPIVYGLARVHSSSLHTYQIVYLFFGVISFVAGIGSYFWLSDSPGQAKYLNEEDRLKAVERLKANQQGIVSHKFNIKHVLEAFTEVKFYLFMLMSIATNVGASTSSVFGPIILQQLVGFTADRAVLLNIPFGFLQFAVTILGSWLAMRFKYKGPILAIFIAPIIVGVGMLYGLAKTKANQGPLLLGYYLVAFVFALNPLILAWMGANCAGQTKKATYYTAFNAASAIGNIIAPYLFKSKYAPAYKPSMQGVLIIFSIMLAVVVLQMFNLIRLQKKKENQRVALGFAAKLVDHSMDRKYVEAHAEVHAEKELEDATDIKNPFFIYLL